MEAYTRLTVEEVKKNWQKGYYTPAGYLFHLFSAMKKQGWKITITSIKDFCQEIGLGERQFYRAKAKLISQGDLQEQIQGILVVWVTDKSVSPTDKSVSPTDKSVSPTDKSVSPTDRSVSPTDRSVSEAPLKALQGRGSSDSPDLDQIYFRSISERDQTHAQEKDPSPFSDLNFGQEIETQQNEFQQPAQQHPVTHTEPISDPLPQNAVTVGDSWKVPPGFSLSENEIRALFSVDPIENLSRPAITDPWVGNPLRSHPDAYPWRKLADRDLAQAWFKFFNASWLNEGMAVAILRKGNAAYPGSRDYAQVHDVWVKWVQNGIDAAASGATEAQSYADPKWEQRIKDAMLWNRLTRDEAIAFLNGHGLPTRQPQYVPDFRDPAGVYV